MIWNRAIKVWLKYNFLGVKTHMCTHSLLWPKSCLSGGLCVLHACVYRCCMCVVTVVCVHRYIYRNENFVSNTLEPGISDKELGLLICPADPGRRADDLPDRIWDPVRLRSRSSPPGFLWAIVWNSHIQTKLCSHIILRELPSGLQNCFLEPCVWKRLLPKKHLSLSSSTSTSSHT